MFPARPPHLMPPVARLARRGAAIALPILWAAGVLAPGAGAGATAAAGRPPSPAPRPAVATATPALVAPPLAPGLDQVPVTSTEFDAAQAKATDLEERVRQATRTRVSATSALVLLHQRDTTLTAEIADASGRQRLATKRIGVIRAALRDLAVANYITGNAADGGSVDPDFTIGDSNEVGKQKVMVGIVNRDTVQKLRKTRAALDKANLQIRVATSSRTEVRHSIDTMADVRANAARDEVALGNELFAAVTDVEATRHLAKVDGVDFPLVVLDAYVKAADVLAVAKPSCGIQWWAMAGIGQTESAHGTEGGAAVRVDGSLTKPILGIPLDGTNATAVVAGPGGFDRAQGPMQFISSTWASWQHDGNADGKMDIQNLYDSAVAAAFYLCAGGAMRTDADLERGYFSYNQSIFYVAIVLGRAHAYEAALKLPKAALPPG